MKQTNPLIFLITGLSVLMAAVFAGLGLPVHAEANQCQMHLSIERWNNQRQIEAQGFHFFVEDTGTSSFEKEYIQLSVAPDLDGDYSSARINEVNTSEPVEEWVKCWQADASRHIEAEYRIRWGTSEINPSLTETAYLANAAAIGFDPQAKFTAVGVVRSPVLGTYGAIVAQDAYADPTGQIQGFLALHPLFEIDATEWHTVRLTVWEQRARVEVEQNGTTVLLDEQLTAPLEAMGAEFSVDNELLPGLFAPIATGDSLEIDYVRISATRN